MKLPLFSIERLALAALSVCLLASPARAQKLADVVVAGPPIAPALDEDGQGLCVASNVWTRPVGDLPQTRGTYINAINGYFEEAENRQTRVTSVLRTPFDLSNNLNDGRTLSYGDFVGQVTASGCSTGGCSFNIIDDAIDDAIDENGASTPFVSRFRGYLNIPESLSSQKLHLGFYTDDAVSFVIYDRAQSYTVISRPHQVGAPTWRTTNAITFASAGLYPVEILYAQVGEHAALEMSLSTSAFTDFERAANQPPVVNLYGSGFELLKPAQFFQTENGLPAYADSPDLCEQCDRADANTQGNSTCGASRHCNSAALCSPCDSALFCGASCTPCGPSAPYCTDLNGVFQCVACTEDSQCTNGRCDLTDNTCRGCNGDEDCPETGHCDLATNQCAGCNDNGDCPGSTVCDERTATCVFCIEDAHCPAERPFCLDGQACVQCRTDLECGDGQLCLGGECSSCTTDRHCGSRCEACDADAPFCLSDDSGKNSACVACRNHDDCSSGQCDPTTHSCENASACAVTCDAGLVCDGAACVECLADAHCPCGGTCDAASKTCSTSCQDSDDEPGNPPQGGGCGCRITEPATQGGSAISLFLLAVALLLLRSRRRALGPGRRHPVEGRPAAASAPCSPASRPASRQTHPAPGRSA